MSFFSQVIDSIFPLFCLGCHKEGSYVCVSCKDHIEIMYDYTCRICKQSNKAGMICTMCHQDSCLDALYYVTSFEQELIKRMLHVWKQTKSTQLEEIIHECIKKYLTLHQLQFTSDVAISYIPLYKRNERFRGFNQAKHLANMISKDISLPVLDCLKKVKASHEHSTLKDYVKKVNIENTLQVKQIPFKNIILVDDFYDSGITLNYASELLKKAGIKQVYGFVFARSKCLT